MWRYFVGAAAGLLLVLAGMFLFRGNATQDLPPPPMLPVSDPAAQSGNFAEPIPEPPKATERTREQRRFDRYDRDHDDRITREEYLRNRRTSFSRLDTNGDGRLSFEEWAITTTTKFARADRDRSGNLTRTEFATTRVVPRPRPTPSCRCPSPAPMATPDNGNTEE